MLSQVLQALAEDVTSAFARQITDPAQPDYGGVVRPDWGLADPGSAAGLITGCAYLHLEQAGPRRYTPDISPSELLARALLAAPPSRLVDVRDAWQRS